MKQKFKFNRKIILKFIGILIIFIAVLLIYFVSNFQIRTTVIDLQGQKFGIIDDKLSKKYAGVTVINRDNEPKNTNKSHGDQLVTFIQNNYSNYNIYYYNAEFDSKITSDSIINGLNALRDKGVDRINISLSSKIYSNEIQEWIHANEDVRVYASYNNSVNTYDYPAMYDGVIASGENQKGIKYKDIDIKYKSKKILSLNKIGIYKGNSYLSIISMLENKEEENGHP